MANFLTAPNAFTAIDTSSRFPTFFEVKGLCLDINKVLMIPGNHDKLFQSNLDQYFNYLCFPAKSMDEPKPRNSYLVSKIVNEQEFIFILLDASIYLNES